MNKTKIKFIKKFKAYFIRLKLHRIIGFISDYLIYIGYLSKMSRWIEKNKKSLRFNDFYNNKVVHKDREKLYQFVVETENLQNKTINYIEFGVGKGNSLRWWADNNQALNSAFWGFDTYEGLPEKWGSYEAGTFSLEGKYPDIKDQRINFVKGLFQDTLFETIPKMDFSGKTIIHMDGDLYSSALFPLTTLYKYLKPGDLIIFDEFVVPAHEFKAFDDFTRSYYMKMEPIGAINNYLQMAFKVK